MYVLHEMVALEMDTKTVSATAKTKRTVKKKNCCRSFIVPINTTPDFLNYIQQMAKWRFSSNNKYYTLLRDLIDLPQIQP